VKRPPPHAVAAKRAGVARAGFAGGGTVCGCVFGRKSCCTEFDWAVGIRPVIVATPNMLSMITAIAAITSIGYNNPSLSIIFLRGGLASMTASLLSNRRSVTRRHRRRMPYPDQLFTTMLDIAIFTPLPAEPMSTTREACCSFSTKTENNAMSFIHQSYSKVCGAIVNADASKTTSSNRCASYI
jgi:hypothetical protein